MIDPVKEIRYTFFQRDVIFLENGKVTLDTSGNALHAHGGCMMKFGGYYYWYGQDIQENRYVSCYRSTDLEHWEFRNAVLTADSPVEPAGHSTYSRLKSHLLHKKVNIERPKVIYCERTGKYVMWAHYENGFNYKKACACVATCDTPDGDFTYHGAFRPLGNMSRDCTLFQEHGRAYFISASNDNKDLKIYALTEDYLSIQSEIATVFAGKVREAPTVFFKDGLYYMLTSACTGWTPNQSTYSFSKSIAGPWSPLKNFGDETTYHSQPTWVLEHRGEYVYIGDRWGGDGKKFLNSTYVVLPIRFAGDEIQIFDAPSYEF